ncbi:MAG: hypothetical protein BWY82_01524 [Verrucomicrobia bacterium ADurb.Bin474]|nr:MAG: hypothetical protein BWY82_01524 [Verrucomicrobia bacterium ADurb.Bin474]
MFDLACGALVSGVEANCPDDTKCLGGVILKQARLGIDDERADLVIGEHSGVGKPLAHQHGKNRHQIGGSLRFNRIRQFGREGTIGEIHAANAVPCYAGFHLSVLTHGLPHNDGVIIRAPEVAFEGDRIVRKVEDHRLACRKARAIREGEIVVGVLSGGGETGEEEEDRHDQRDPTMGAGMGRCLVERLVDPSHGGGFSLSLRFLASGQWVLARRPQHL